jgi:Ca2+-binding RTX toxin-like protein
MAWTPLPDPATTGGLLANWRGDGSGSLINHLPSLPVLTAVGAVGAATASFEAVGAGNLMVGGAGDDIYHVFNPLDVVLEAPGDGLDHIIASVSFALAADQSVEWMTAAAGSGGIALTGNALANRFISNAAYADTLTGGAGNDTFAVYHAGDRVIEAAGGGTDRIDAYANHVLFANSSVEFIYAMGSAGRSLTGNALANRFISNAAYADTLTGGAGNDTYHLHNAGDRVIERASGGTDVIYSSVHYTLANAVSVEELRASNSVGLRLTGNALNQQIHGGKGRDTLEGGGGQDRLFGGADKQADRFVFRSLSDSATGAGRDLIYQFQSGIDQIDLRAMDANTTRSGNQAFVFSADGPKAFGLWLVTSSSGVLVRIDATGDARADSEIWISGVTRAVQGDFLL